MDPVFRSYSHCKDFLMSAEAPKVYGGIVFIWKHPHILNALMPMGFGITGRPLQFDVSGEHRSFDFYNRSSFSTDEAWQTVLYRSLRGQMVAPDVMDVCRDSQNCLDFFCFACDGIISFTPLDVLSAFGAAFWRSWRIWHAESLIPSFFSNFEDWLFIQTARFFFVEWCSIFLVIATVVWPRRGLHG